MCHAMTFLARALKKNIFFDVDIVVKNKSKCGLSWSVLLPATSTCHCSFPKHFFVLFLHIKRVCKSFWRESLTRTSSHLHNAARALQFKVFVWGKFLAFRESLVYSFKLVFSIRCVRHYFLICRVAALRWQPITSVEVKFVARQVETPVVIRATKLKFVAESRTGVYFSQHLASTCNIVFVARQVGHAGGNTRNREFQLALQQCCKTSWRKMLPVLPDL